MQREDPDGIVIVCDFCRRDWDGQEAMVEGHHGSILCLACMERALAEQAAGGEKYNCTMCLRFNISPELPRWTAPGHPESVVCQECMYQAAKAFGRNKEVAFTWNASRYPPAVKPPRSEAPAEALGEEVSKEQS